MYKYVYLCLKRSDRRYLLENFERQGDLLPLAERESQQINLIVNRPKDENVTEIDLARVFRNMKKKLRVYLWIMLLCFTAGVCAALLLYQVKKKPLTVSSVVTLNYDVVKRDSSGQVTSRTPVKLLTAPDGKELDLTQVTSSYVLQAAMDGLTLSQPVTLAELRDNIQIDRILTEDSRRKQEVASRMISDKNTGAFTQVQNIDLTYINSFVVSLTNGFGQKEIMLTDTELQLVLDRVMTAYNEYLVATYADLKLPDNVIAAIDIQAQDIQETLDMLRTAVQDLYSFCEDEPETVRSYRSWRTGRSLNDLMAELQTVREVSVNYLNSYVYANDLVRDREAVTTSYQYRLRNLQTKLAAIEEKTATNQGILDNYKNDEIFVSMQESDSSRSTKTTTDYYNNLIIEQAKNFNTVAQLEEQISDIEDKLEKLDAARTDASLIDPAKADAELSSVIDICSRAYDQIKEQFQEIIDSPSFTTFADHSVAQGKGESLFSAAKKVALGGFAGLFIGCGLWLLSGIAPEFRLKKEEESIRKEVAEG